jgi:hypothetical protein
MSDQLYRYPYDFIMKQNQNMNRLKYKLPNDTMKLFANVKQKLNIKESDTFKRPYQMDKTQINKQKHELAEVYKVLNKITDKTYDKLSEQILTMIQNISNIECQKEICAKIFTIISSNSFYSDIYAKLYSQMIVLHESFADAFNEEFRKYMMNFENIKYISSNEDYDKYCDYVKHINSIESMCKFFIKCMSYNICSANDIVSLILFLQQKLINQTDDEEKISENEAYISNIYLLIKECCDTIMFHEQWEFVERNNSFLYDVHGVGKTNKIRFKLMDISDFIKKQSS